LVYSRPYLLRLKGATLDLSGRTHIMGILNVTPDSFSDGGRFVAASGRGAPETGRAVEAALRMVEEGADMIDVGGESTRPGSDRLTAEAETARVIPVIEGIKRHSDVPISIDTYKAVTARAAVGAGASIINDISGLTLDPGMPAAAAETGAALIIMHMKGTPADMQDDPRYDDLVGEVAGFLRASSKRALAAGVAEDRILLDVGIGFGKTVEHNLTLIRRLSEFADIGFPLVLGVSRKAFIGGLTGGAGPSDRLEGTIAASVLGIVRGANVLRVHDVKAAKRAALVADAVLRAR
jgi:dihydropteroate synthase